MSFSRRSVRHNNPNRQEPDLASLLASMAAKQALSPTAQALAESSRDAGQDALLPCKVALFASGRSVAALPAASKGSFNVDAARRLVNAEQEK